MDLLSRALSKSAPRESKRPPHWDVNIILFSLKCRPYEPLSAEGLKDFKMKTLFLVTLAPVHRVSELEALSSGVILIKMALPFSNMLMTSLRKLNFGIEKFYEI